ncbi:hypothetical protein OHR68_37830 [Spirillospora sp. NBC_00431]
MTASPDVFPTSSSTSLNLSTSLNAIKSSQARQRPVVMIIYAVDGPPRIFVPDAGELRVLDDRFLRVAIWPGSPTAADLDRGLPILLIVPAAPDVHLVRATARRLDNAAMVWAHYDLTVTSARIATRGTAPFAQPARVSDETDPGEGESEELLTSVRQKRLVRMLS